MKTTSKNKNELKSKSDTVTVFNEKDSIIKITETYKELVKYSLIAFKRAIELGEELQTVKDNKPHGAFIPWIKKNVPFISERTARRYMTIYNKQDILREKLGDNLELKKAYELLSEKKEKVINKLPEPEPSTIDLVKEHNKLVAKNKNKLRKKKILPPPEIRTEVKVALLSDKEKEEIRIQKANDLIKKSISKLEEIQSDLHLLETANRTP